MEPTTSREEALLRAVEALPYEALLALEHDIERELGLQAAADNALYQLLVAALEAHERAEEDVYTVDLSAWQPTDVNQPQ
jgi:hypothetical protein